MDVCSKSTTVYDLPPEILVLIFSSYVESEGNTKLYTVLAKVSTSWRKAALAPSLWTEVSFTTNDFKHGHSWLNDEDILELISLLKTLHFKSIPIFDRFLNPGLLNFRALEQILKNSRNLENFYLEYLDAHMQLVPDFLFHLPTFCPKITGIQIKRMSCLVQNNLFPTLIAAYNMNLTRLILRNIVFRYMAADILCQNVAMFCPNMTNFELDCWGGQLLHNAVYSIQTGCPKMKDLCFRNVTVTEDNDLTPCFLHLEKFCFRPHLSKRDVNQTLVWVLRGSKGLKELELIDADFKAETLLQLPCKSLRKLKIHRSHITTKDLGEILCHWKHSLMELDVLCKETSQQCLLRYIEQYGKDNLESLSLHVSSPEMGQVKRILRQCRKLKFLLLDDIDGVEYSILLNTREKIIKWLNL